MMPAEARDLLVVVRPLEVTLHHQVAAHHQLADRAVAEQPPGLVHHLDPRQRRRAAATAQHLLVEAMRADMLLRPEISTDQRSFSLTPRLRHYRPENVDRFGEL